MQGELFDINEHHRPKPQQPKVDRYAAPGERNFHDEFPGATAWGIEGPYGEWGKGNHEQCSCGRYDRLIVWYGTSEQTHQNKTDVGCWHCWWHGTEQTKLDL